MAEIVYSTAADSFVTHTHVGTDAADVVGDATDSGTFHNNTAIYYSWGVRNRTFAVRGGGSNSSFRNHRSFYTFDLSGYSGTATDAEFYFYSDNLGTNATNESTIYVVQATTLAGSTADFGNVFSSGTTLGTLYGSTTISTALGYHTITLNSDAISDINTAAAASNTLTIGLMGYYDYNNTDPSTNAQKIAIYYSEFGGGGGTGADPKLELTFTSAGYSHNVLGVASANIASVNGVATANIESVNGVDT